MKVNNIMIVGVGGQGTLLASRVLGRLCVDAGYDVKVSEVHGMSQRGGSVVTYVRYGEHVASPIIDKGQADYIISFELLEAARYLEYLNPEGILISNNQKIEPMPVITGSAQYPENLEEKIKALGIKTEIFDALAIAEEAGSAKAVNIALLGRFSKHLGFTEKAWEDALCAVVPSKFIELNKKAFELGKISAK